MKYKINSEQLLSSFLRYVCFESRSDENNTQQIPSTPQQIEFSKKLAINLKEIGLDNIFYNEKDGYLTAEIPANDDSKTYPTIGFFAHVDTADFNATDVRPQVIKNYDGKVIPLSDSGYQLDPAEFNSLKKYVGKTLITTDGQTLLGADDKAGIAEIVTAMAYLINNPDIKHGTVKVAFGPDEEIGVGADRFDVDRFKADFAYTMDGGPLGELEYETFNAASANLKINGKNVHPGTAKGIMINALQVGMDFHATLPETDRPEKTAGREGFYHLVKMDGNVDGANLQYIIRDHDREKFEARKQFMQATATKINEDFDREIIELTLSDQYYNMGDIIKDDMRPVSLAEIALKTVKVEADIKAVRGGTDGSKLTYMGLPTPNLFAGGENMHGRFEYVALETMEKATQVIVAIVASSGQYDTL